MGGWLKFSGTYSSFSIFSVGELLQMPAADWLISEKFSFRKNHTIGKTVVIHFMYYNVNNLLTEFVR